MGIRKFRSVEDMKGPPPRKPLDPANLEIACAPSKFAASLRPGLRRPGVHKYRDVDDPARLLRWTEGLSPVKGTSH